jgi:hypothetical protein
MIWENTSVQMDWIAEELSMKSPSNMSQQLRRWRLAPRRLPTALTRWVHRFPLCDPLVSSVSRERRLPIYRSDFQL